MRTDDELVNEAQTGNLTAFDALMVRYERLVCKVALHHVRNRESALDVTQNVFLKAYNHLESVTADGMFKPWLLRITHNESINWLRKQSRSSARESSEELDERPTDDPDQEQQVERGEQQQRLVQSLATLNPRYRLAVSLRYADGLRIREIADVMDCSEGMVKSLLFRGVRQIRQRVERGA